MSKRRIILWAAALLVASVVLTVIVVPSHERVGGRGKSHWGGRFNYVMWPLHQGTDLWPNRQPTPEYVGPFDLEIVGHDGTVYRDSGDRVDLAVRIADGRRFVRITFTPHHRTGVLGRDGELYDPVDGGYLRDVPRTKDGRPFDCKRPRRIRVIIADKYLFEWDRDEEPETGP